MIAFGWVTNLLQRGRASWGRMLRGDGHAAGDRRRRRDADPTSASAIMRGAIELRHLTFAYGERRGPRTTSTSTIRSRADRRDRRPHGLGQVDAAVAARAPARSAAGDGVPRRHRRPRAAAGDGARRDRLRAAGAVPVLRHACRERRVWRRAGRSDGGVDVGRSRQDGVRALPGSTRTSPTFRRATRPASASAASRCRAGRSSGRRSRARCTSIRAS